MSDFSPNATLLKFGYPHTLLHSGRYWALLVRPSQPTLGSLVLCTAREETSYGHLPVEAFVEQREIVARIEQFLAGFVRHERLNYLMLMMVDPHVHFHVIPRYEGERRFDDSSFVDHGWPGIPSLSTTEAASDTLIDALRASWNSAVNKESEI